MRHAVLWVVLAGCQFPGAPEALPCSSDGACADGSVCVEDRCVPAQPSCTEAIASGDEHSCAIRDDHTAWCWGRNNAGQLGDGTAEDRAAPVAVAGGMKFLAIAAGNDHTCAVRDDHTAWCWGSNAAAQLGGPTSSLSPVQVEKPTGVAAIASGRSHSCALLDDGTVTCWGANDGGQLGSGNRMVSRIPLPVRNLVATEIAAGGDATCAIDRDRALWCWGDNQVGQLGVGDKAPHLVPAMARVDAVAHVAVGSGFMCAVNTAGEVYCAGSNSHFQLADSSSPMDRPVPRKIELQVAIDAITAGARFACATERADAHHSAPRPWCWGEGSSFQFGDGIADNRADPAPTLHRDVVASAGGGAHLCVLSDGGGLTCSGDASRGQLGDGTRTTQARPLPSIAGLAEVASIAAGEQHTCALVRDGSILCWGRNAAGQLGDGTRLDHSTPVRAELPPAMGVTAGDDHSCALLADRRVACWGTNIARQLGHNDGDRAVARLVPDGAAPLEGAVQVAAGPTHTCAVIEAGGERFVKCWGMNERGQCGGGQTSPTSPVVRAMRVANVLEVAVGDRHTCALGNDGKVQCWGGNAYGELGAGTAATPTMDYSLEPIAVVGVTDALHIAARGPTTCALLRNGDVTCWGEASTGLIGDGNTGSVRSPPEDPVIGVSGATRLAMGLGHACAVSSAGLACWGIGAFGQLGNGGYDLSPAALPIGLAGAKDVAAGGQHSCAVLANDTVACWGDDRAGQLGDGVSAPPKAVAPLLPCP